MAIDFNADQNRMGLALLAAAGPSARPMSFGQRMFMGMGQHDQYLAEKEQREQLRKAREAQLAFQQFQMAQMVQEQAERKAAQERAAAIEGAYRGAIRTPQQQAMQQFGGPTQAAATAAPGMVPQIDQRALIESLAKVDPMTAFQMMLPKERKLTTVAPGASLIDESDPTKAVFTAPDKADKPPTSVQEFLYAQQNPAFSAWDESRRRAGATNIGLPRIDIKTGEGVAGQVGPMLKGSQEQAMAGLKLVDSAQRILTATQGGNVFLGPMADIRLKAAQFADLLGVGGKDNAEKIENTRAVVRGMAEQAVAARSQLGGQAQISNAEQELINKATSGSIGELTGPETIQIAKLNDRLGRALYAKHQSMLKGLQSVPDTQNLMPFFQVPPLPEVPKFSAPTGMPGANAIEAELRRRQQQTGDW
ncbi:MAG: hypothetical protein IPG77_01245 [Betaproteobacteria bacterium]|nr:hypothetical protein [Betaproteobacteria bacterium]